MKILVRGGAEITSLLLAVVATLWVIRGIGPTYFGYYAVTVTIVTIGGVLINAGLSTAGSQRIANEPSRAGEVAWVIMVSRGLIATAIVIVGFVVLAVVPIDSVLRSYLRVGLIVWALAPFKNEWVLVGQGRLKAISGLRVVGSAATLLAAVLLVRDVSDADRVAWILVVGAIVSTAGSSFAVHRRLAIRRPLDVAIMRTAREYLRGGLHYLKSDVSVFIFTGSDRLFLYAFATPAVVGLYAAAYSVIQPFYTISAVVGDAMYLPLAQSFGTDGLRLLFRRYVDLMCFATIPLGFFLLAFAPTVVAILLGTKYVGAGGYLAILGWVITFGYTSGIAVIPFSAWNRPREYGNATALGGAVNLGLNFGLIPPFEGFGAAWATVAAKVAVTLAGIRYFRRATDYPIVRDFAEYFAISAAACGAGLAASELLSYGPIAGIAVFTLVYLTLVAFVRWPRSRALTIGVTGAVVTERPDASTHAR